MSTSPSSFKHKFYILCYITAALVIVELVNLVTGRSLNAFGLIPRTTSGLLGIFTAPFLHANLAHFFANIVPFVVFSFLLLQHGTKRYLQVTVICITLSGLLVWGLARDAVHIGASGLIYGYFGYLVLAGFIAKKIKLLLISLFVGISYGTLIFGVLPVARYISWESHLFGLIVGLISAYYLNSRKNK